MKKSLCFTLILIIFWFSLSGAGEKKDPPRDFKDFEELKLEELLDVEVVTTSKKPQKLSEAPACVYVITDEDIKQSGATNIPDVLRMVPGLDVMEITSSQFEINPRGLSGPLTNRLLILIDGRTVYIDFFGGTNWESFPGSLDEIKKIEVVKGPSSALWGANAFSGVINIITKTSNEIKGGLVSGVGGENSFSSSSFIYGRTLKNLGFKVSAGWKRLNEFKDRFTYLSDKKSERGMKFNSTFD